MNITATLPALKANLLNSASLEVLPTTGHADDVAHATVSLANPFTADLVITKVQSSVTFHGITLGTIEKGAVDWSEESVAGKFAAYIEENVKP